LFLRPQVLGGTFKKFDGRRQKVSPTAQVRSPKIQSMPKKPHPSLIVSSTEFMGCAVVGIGSFLSPLHATSTQRTQP
jgi:hypothetical protein